ncbi:uncharacterized protein LOC111380181 [Olea europaea var. sylvestris]|uniref:uncharacterized protein LOC111380181 n=1 Tax=Olea europaea var. sylvestris TaxID=158386 RepID=UPI000C1D3B38|nr:uncharacterized protein LOC111380181 [Olea europaea var. sylvestris]
MKLNLLKCAFGFASSKFLGYMVNQREIEANPEKIKALFEMRSPRKPKEVQSLTGRVAALSRFVSKATYKYLPFFKILKARKKSKWNEECKEAFQGLKRYLGEEGTTQLLVYYTSKIFLFSETRYPDMEKLALALIIASRKLRPYFQAHTIHVLTNFPLRTTIKAQALADFVAEFANVPGMEEVMEPVELPVWNLFVDGSAGDTSSRAGVVLISLEGHKLNSTVRFGFKATKNAAMDKTMTSYLKMVMNLLLFFEKVEIIQISRLKNAHADALSKLASSKDSKLLVIVPIEHLLTPSIEAPKVMWVEGTPTWMQQIIAYLKDQVLPTDKDEAYKLRRSNHSGGLALAQKVLRQRYYWPTLKKDALQFVCKCNKCQRFSPIQKQPLQELTTVSSQ